MTGHVYTVRLCDDQGMVSDQPVDRGGVNEHPEHGAMARAAGGVWFPAQPLRASFWLQRRRQRACHKAGGHWWHPADAMIAWFCCQCGADRDGMPQDGSR